MYFIKIHNTFEHADIAKACAEALKAMKWPHCAFCNGIIAYEPYVEVIDGKKVPFHAKACAEAYKKKKS